MDPSSDETQTPDHQDQAPPEVVKPKPEPWTKKRTRKPKPKPKPRTARHGVAGRHWTWKHLNVFQPVHKWTVYGRLVRPTLRTTIPGCIYYAMKRVKRGSDVRVHKAAIEDGLEALTVQNTLWRVQKELRLLAKLGVIKRKKHPKTQRRRK
jgi:hypothetical protein